jgi:NADH:ubiquinone oxidoreductase subunit 6 (subunit J)
MSAEVLVFDILAVIAVIAGCGVVLARNPVHSAVSLVVTFVNLAGIFVMLRAEFLGAVQILLYAGANVRAAARIHGYTPLFVASEYVYAGVIVALL